MLRLLLLILCLSSSATWAEPPVAYQGRIRPLEAAARLWLYDFYHAQAIRSYDLSATDFQWRLDLEGHKPWDDMLLFWISSAEAKEALKLNSKGNRFSYNQLRNAFVGDADTNLAITKRLIAHAFSEAYQNPANRSGATKLELTSLSPGLWASLRGNIIVLVQAPNGPLWQYLKPGMEIGELSNSDKRPLEELTALWNTLAVFDHHDMQGHIVNNDTLSEMIDALKQRGAKPASIAQLVEMQLPLRQRLLEAGSDLRMLPGRLSDGEWYSIRAVDIHVYDAVSDQIIPIPNFTIYPDPLFEKIRSHYHAQDLVALSEAVAEGYEALAGKPYRESAEKILYYPTMEQLEAETWYYRLPLTNVTLIIYAIAAVTLTLAISLARHRLGTFGLVIMSVAWLIQTGIIVLRCYILARPPVANMFETVIYVPWIAATLSFVFFYTIRSLVIPLAASLLAVVLLAVLQLTQINSGMETLQPVLDSQYWLIIHVLLVVASYGVFLLSGILGHIYLASKRALPEVAKAILHTMYLGTGMLIAGTILGGVWAAESWGRFWDWDPKESWAFISSCIYLVCIHAYTFNYVKDVGLAIGSIVGLWAISFTWYGVNYILGTGMHSYGFGSGGEIYYYLFLAAEVVFVLSAGRRKEATK